MRFGRQCADQLKWKLIAVRMTIRVEQLWNHHVELLDEKIHGFGFRSQPRHIFALGYPNARMLVPGRPDHQWLPTRHTYLLLPLMLIRCLLEASFSLRFRFVNCPLAVVVLRQTGGVAITRSSRPMCS